MSGARRYFLNSKVPVVMIHDIYVVSAGFAVIGDQRLPVLSVVILSPLIVVDSTRGGVFRRLKIEHDGLGVF